MLLKRVVPHLHRSTIKDGGHMFQFKTQIITTLCIAFLALMTNAAAPSDALSVTCETKSNRIETVFNTGNKKLKQVLPVQLPLSSFTAAKLKGCAAIQTKSKFTVRPLSPSLFKDYSEGQIVGISLPATMNGMAFDLQYDWIVLKKKKGGEWISGPIVEAGGLENSVDNQIGSASEKEIIVRQIYSGEGDTSEEKVTFLWVNGAWQQSK